jgi:hypothetical protein
VISATAIACFGLLLSPAFASNSLTAQGLRFAVAPGSDDVCGAWSLHGYRIGMIKEDALEVQIEENPRADVVAVKRGGRQITFRYADGGRGRVLFDSEDRVRAIESSRTAPWDRVVPPPKTAMAFGKPPRLFWLDDSCDVGAVATNRWGMRVTSATAFRKKWRDRFDLNMTFPTASSYGLGWVDCALGGDILCACWCYDRWGPVGDCAQFARYMEARWRHYLSNLRTQPWRVDAGSATGVAGSYVGGNTSGGGYSSTGRSSSSGRVFTTSGRGSSSAGGHFSSGGSGSRTSAPSRPSGSSGGRSTVGGGAVKRR